ncbi:MAG TPA: YceI family protein [Pseudonocardiaceae bacterium]|nr:YceI family protein [Pseudonocardiaceae bacterium]
MSETLTDTGPVTIPPAGDYHIDRRHSAVTFTARHLFGLGSVHGAFDIRAGHIHVADDVGASDAHAVIAAGSVRTGNATRDAAIRSAGFLGTDAHPDIAFVGNRVERVGGTWTLRGSLKVRGHARPVDVRVDSARTEGRRLVLRATSRVDRYVFGVTAAKLLVARHLTISLVIMAELA